ncbi:HU family DNA-binding protein [Pseudonocardia xinjiangensis]|uniref:DNA-binding protein n=1 Tax=Pseudonocardia xinjiangensis TaxID=75289 RepID=A0ABX1R916_9PSEU|nr:HU family DNA-binding protein [Pseudonocardia xinjiangensis]NMH76877.1 DNA-binding protein [Pseudonocardia xinjiangensis]
MNKTQLVDALAARLGDRRNAATAVDGLLETIVETVGSGDSVSLPGFGVFTARARAARLARNPRTGETVAVPATTVPAFRPGLAFRSAVSGVAVPPPARSVAASARAATATAVAEPEALAEPAGKPAGKQAKVKVKAGKPAKAAGRSKPASKPAKGKDDKPRKGKKK